MRAVSLVVLGALLGTALSMTLAILLTTTDLIAAVKVLRFDTGDIFALLALAVVVIGWRQAHNSNIEAQRRQLQNEVRVRAYEELNTLVAAADAALAEANSVWRNVPPFGLEQRLQVKPGEGYELSQELNRVTYDFSGSVNEVLMYVEHHRFLLGPLESMRLHIHVDSRKFSRLAYDAWHQLSVDLISDRYQQDAQKFRASAEKLMEPVMERALDVAVYLGDLRTEAQNLLLGDVFGYQAPARRPRDPSQKVLRPGPVEPEWERLREDARATTGVEIGTYPYTERTHESDTGGDVNDG